MISVRAIVTACVVLGAVCFALAPANGAPLARAYAGIYADAEHCMCYVSNPGGFYQFEMWIWWLPADAGMTAAEFAIQYPSNVIQSTVTQNPAITVALGSLPVGISVAFGPCQTGWTWTHHQTCYLTDTQSKFVNIVAHPAVGVYQIATCEPGYPIAPVSILNNLEINSSWCMHPELYPQLVGVTVQTASAIRAVFDKCVLEGIPADCFILRNKADATDYIDAVQAARVNDNLYDLVLARAMADSTTYVLSTRMTHWSCWDGLCSQSHFEFTFVAAVATETSSWGAIRALFGN